MRVNDFFRQFLLMGNCYKPQPKLEVPDIGQMQEIPTNEQSRLIEENNRLVMIYSELLEKMKNLEDENSSLYYSLQQNKKLLDENNNIITNLLEENSKLQDKNKTLSDQISIRKQILAQKEQEIQRFKKGIEHEKNIFSSNTEQIRDINEVVTANTSIKSEKIDISDNSDKKNICDINIKDQRDRAVIQFQSINEKKNQNNNATIKENVQGENNHNIAQQFEA